MQGLLLLPAAGHPKPSWAEGQEHGRRAWYATGPSFSKHFQVSRGQVKSGKILTSEPGVPHGPWL